MTYDEFVNATTMKDMGESKITPQDASELLLKDEVILVDVREDFENDLVEFKIAIHIPFNKLPENLDKLDKNKIIICACPAGFRSNKAVEYLRYKGFKAKNLTGGFKEFLSEISMKNAKRFQNKGV
jgi:rhodanese-related sulfurtransferase